MTVDSSLRVSASIGHPTLNAEQFRDVIGRFASGVTLITTRVEDRAFGTTASAVTSLSLDPPMLLTCLNTESETAQAIVSVRRFAVNILGEDHAELALRFARKGVDEFDGLDLAEGRDGLPLLSDALATLECTVDEVVRGGTHHIFVARVARALGNAGAPLAYFRGQFARLAFAQPESGPGHAGGTRVP